MNRADSNDTNRADWRRTMLVPVLVALVVVSLVGILLDRQNLLLAEGNLREATLAKVSVIRAKLEGNISSNVQLVRGLIATIATEPDMTQARFDDLARHVFQEESQLRSIAVAPGLVITMTYPLSGNAAAIGMDYRTSPSQWPAVEHVMRSGEMNIAGPVDLVQGGHGFIARFPVYIGDGETRHFWGLVSAVVDMDRLYRDSGLFDPDLGLAISITGHDGTGSVGSRFFGPDLSDKRPILVDVVLPSGTWQIAAMPEKGWLPDISSLWLQRGLMLIGGMLILLPIGITGRMVAQRHDYIRDLNAREAELAKLTERLNLAMDVSRVGVWEMDIATGKETWDDRTNEIYGLPQDDGPRSHDHWRATVHPEDRDRAEADFASMIGSGRYQSDYRIVLPSGALRHVRSKAALLSEPGRPDKVIGVNWDVTPDVLLNEDLRLAKQQAEARASELELARSRIEYNALHDSLTGLPNRRYLDETLQKHAGDGYQGSGSIALLHIDLDRFKQINDTLGHAAGDAMLIHASRVLRASCQETDFVARIGGDEFVIVCSAGSDDQRLHELADSIVKEMRKPALHEGHECRFGVSIGVAVNRRPDADVKQLLINADIALYRAKARGRNRHEFFSEALQAEVIHTKRVADELLTALDSQAFVPYYQPQFDAHSLDLVGVEALVRWQHPDEGIKGPDSFMAVAEELNVMAQIDEIVLKRGLADLQRWDLQGLALPRLSVNVSLRRLNDEELIAGLKALDLPQGRLAFELVESIYLDESEGIVAWNIEQIKDMGIDIEIDDFGTGYASIVSLQKLHPRRLKIDRQLVNPIIDEPAQRQLVASIVDIGKSMDIEIVAEGVETREHAHILRDLGCDILQGYTFARPMDARAFEAFVRSQSWRQAG